MEENKTDNKLQSTSLKLIQIGSQCDLLKVIPINTQIKLHGESEVKAKIISAISKCSFATGIDLNMDQMQILSDDIIEVFPYEGIEDIVECLKKGRQGAYGTTYNKLNMIVIREWMSKHLEEKAIAREKEINKLKDTNHDWKDRQDYENAVKVGELVNQKIKEEKESKHKKDVEYLKVKNDYEASRQICKDSLEETEGPGHN